MKDQKILNQKHVENPQIGDYWHEMFCPYFLVVDTNPLTIYDKINHDLWEWDLSDPPKEISLEELKKRVTYNTIPGFIADVIPNKMLDYVQYYLDNIKIPKITEYLNDFHLSNEVRNDEIAKIYAIGIIHNEIDMNDAKKEYIVEMMVKTFYA